MREHEGACERVKRSDRKDSCLGSSHDPGCLSLEPPDSFREAGRGLFVSRYDARIVEGSRLSA
jgi:hypothetical protein